MSSSNIERKDNLITMDQYLVVLDFLKIFKRIWILVLVLVLLGGGISYAKLSHDYVPVYTASSTFTVNIRREQSINDFVAFYDNAAAEQIAQTFPYILTSALLHRTVEADLGTPVTGSINAEVTENTNLLTLSVTDQDPQKAYDTLNSVIKNYPEISEPIVGKVTMNILDETGVPTTPDNPKIFVKETLIGAFIGFILSFLWAFILFITNRTILKEADIKRHLGIDKLGTIPKIHIKKRTKEVSQYFLMSDPAINDILQEPFRNVKNKLEYKSYKHNQKTLLITSTVSGEGKSFFSVNLALSLADSGRKVVLIDCDLRNPTGRLIFNMPKSTGLCEYLKEETSLVEYLMTAKQENNHSYTNLFFLPGGHPVDDGSHLLSSHRMQELIDYIKENSDYVILDSAPVGILTDSAVLARYADGAIMVVRKGLARVDMISDALSHLNGSGIPIIGGILNDT